MTEKITYFQVESIDGSLIDWVAIEHKPNEFRSMTKEHYEKLQAEQSTPIDTGDE
jgi:hypothetical protein